MNLRNLTRNEQVAGKIEIAYSRVLTQSLRIISLALTYS
jgi:hypothetical protein